MKKLIMPAVFTCASAFAFAAGANTTMTEEKITGPSADIPLKIIYSETPVAVSDSAALQKVKDEVASYGVLPTKQFDPSKNLTAVKCFETAEVKGTVFCVFNSRKAQSEILLRSDSFVEATKGKYFTRADFFSTGPIKEQSGVGRDFFEYCRGNTPAYDGIRGYDLPGKKFNAFLNKNLKDTTAAADDKTLQTYSRMESLFLDFMQNTIRAKYGNNYTLISSLANDDFIPILSHEFLHAQYFTEPKFAKNVNSYVDSLEGTKELEMFTKFAVATKAYTNIDKIKSFRDNEFLAFMLATGSYEDALKRFPTDAAVMLRALVPAAAQTADQKAFFDEMFSFWQKNNWAVGKDFDKLNAQSFDILKKYNLPKTIDAEGSAFYKYLADKGTPPIIIK